MNPLQLTSAQLTYWSSLQLAEIRKVSMKMFRSSLCTEVVQQPRGSCSPLYPSRRCDFPGKRCDLFATPRDANVVEHWNHAIRLPRRQKYVCFQCFAKMKAFQIPFRPPPHTYALIWLVAVTHNKNLEMQKMT